MALVDCVDDYYQAANYDMNDCLLNGTALSGSVQVGLGIFHV